MLLSIQILLLHTNETPYPNNNKKLNREHSCEKHILYDSIFYTV